MIGLAIVAAALAQNAPAPQWRSVSVEPAGEVFVDPASLRRDGDSFEIDVRAVFDPVTSSGLKMAWSRNRYNCARHSWMALTVRYSGPNGEVLFEGPASGSIARDQPAGTDSPNGAILRDYCQSGRTA